MQTNQHTDQTQFGARFLDVEPAPTVKRAVRGPQAAARTSEKARPLAEQPSPRKPARYGAGF